MASLAPFDQPPIARTLLGHPRGLFLLFFTELWERFSCYRIRAILVFYLTKHFLLYNGSAFAIYGANTSLIYLTLVIGGYLADHHLGARTAVRGGGVFIAIGHLLIALLEGPGRGAGAVLQRLLPGPCRDRDRNGLSEGQHLGAGRPALFA